MTQTTYLYWIIGGILTLLPLWIGHRRKITFLPMFFIMVIGGILPFIGWLVGLYIALRAASKEPKVSPLSPGQDDL